MKTLISNIKSKIIRRITGKNFVAFCLSLFFVFISLNIYSQLDTNFWFAAPEVTVGHGDRPIFIYVTSDLLPSDVTISQPANPAFPPINFQLPANATQAVDLTEWIDIIENKPSNTVLNYGINITATNPVNAYYAVERFNNPDIFTLKGKNSLGYDFFIPMQNITEGGNYNPVPYASFDIVATEDNTAIRILPTTDLVGHPANQYFLVTLNRGQTYSAEPLHFAPEFRPGGTRVGADKPIAITIKDDSMRGNIFGGGCRDLGGDQIVPITIIGSEYIAVRGFLNDEYDKVFILATKDNTEVYANNVLQATIDEGETHVYSMGTAGAVYINTSHPAYVIHMSGFGCEIGLSILPQIHCTGSFDVTFTRVSDEPFFLTILVREGGEDSFLLNGEPGIINAVSFDDVPATDGQWKYTQLEMNLNEIPAGVASRISNTKDVFHVGTIHGTTTGGCRFGYFSDFAARSFNIPDQKNIYCMEETITLEANSVEGANYHWTGPNGFSAEGQTIEIGSADVSHTGYYFINDYSSVFCPILTDSIYIQVVPDPVITILPEEPFVCQGDSIELLISGAVNYEWDSTYNFYQDTGDIVIAYPDLTTTYNIIGTDEYGCVGYTSITISVDNQVDATINSQTQDLCITNNSISLMAANPNGTWSGQGVTGNVFSPAEAGPGVHTISYEIINGACSDIDSIIISVYETVDATITPVGPLCETDEAVTLYAVDDGGTWTGAGIDGNIFNPNIAGHGTHKISYGIINGACHDSDNITIHIDKMVDATITPAGPVCETYEAIILEAVDEGGIWSGEGVTGNIFNSTSAGIGTHTITYEIINGVCSDTDSIYIEVNPDPEVLLHIPSDKICYNDDLVNLQSSPTGGVFIGSGIVDDKFSPEIAGSGPHEIVYEYTNEFGCYNSTSITVEVSQPIDISLSGDNPLCYGDNGGMARVIVSGGSPDYSYQWDDNLNSTTPIITDITAGTYYITVTDSWSCVEKDSITLINPPILMIEIDSKSDIACYGVSDGSATVSVQGGTEPYSYKWSDENNSATPSINNVPADIYTITVTDNNLCVETRSIEINTPEEIFISTANVEDASCFGYNDGYALINAIGGTQPYEYLWDNATQSTTAYADNLTAGNYNVTLTDANNCTEIKSVTINEPSEIKPIITSHKVICTYSLGRAEIGATGGISPYAYSWESGNTGTTETDLTVGTYFVTITDANNCTKIEEYEISSQGTISAFITQDKILSCYGFKDASLFANTTNGIHPVGYYWSNGVSQQYNNNIGADVYKVTLTDSWGCKGEASHIVTEPSAIIGEAVNVGNTLCYDDSGSIELAVYGGTPPYAYYWDNGSTGSHLTGLLPGDYTVSIVDSNNCILIRTFTIVSPSEPIYLYAGVENVSCYGDNDGSVFVNATGGYPPYKYIWNIEDHYNVQNVSNLFAGNYRLKILDSEGCSLDTVININQPSEIEVLYYLVEPTCDINNNGYIEFEVTGGIPPYSYSWEDNRTYNSRITGLSSGEYSFTITDNNNCKKSPDIIMPDNPDPCIRIASAFTPNGDGINDEWIIEGIDNIDLVENAIIQVYNRWGQLMWEGREDSPPWDGTWNGKVVPTASYLYTIDLLNGIKYCGIVTVVK